MPSCIIFYRPEVLQGLVCLVDDAGNLLHDRGKLRVNFQGRLVGSIQQDGLHRFRHASLAEVKEVEDGVLGL